MRGPEDRHITQESLDDYLATGVRASIPIAGHPAARLAIDCPNETLRMEISWDGEEPPNTGSYEHLSTDVRFDGQQNWASISVHGRRFFREAHPLLRSVADLVQLQGLTFADAVLNSLATYHELLASSGQMSARDEVGLFGELMVIRNLIDVIGGESTLRAWRGGDQNEEHDLGLKDDDVEIKTTTADRRTHWIGSLNQLRPTVGRRLWLLSIQVTAAGASHAQRLPDLVDEIEQRMTSAHQVVFRRRLTDAGFRWNQPADTYRLLRLRTVPCCYAVDEQFPRIDRDILARGGAAVTSIGEVSYTIDLEGLPPSAEPPSVLESFCRGNRE